ncbi:MAG: hypothetical protein F4Z41_00440 [Acidimicrobiia bacterium]|nr:hypothetical protein [bacterium]MXX01327.1 hypothetical protein [Acidimicrobiia bacterium]MDE0675424.1 hypothetical protein [bacterium]MXX44655.1 hypothetical protein [Acidimicrobiia bacterium]MXY75433.1 hypothetical protein [Acidimicrobiia bacterium]
MITTTFVMIGETLRRLKGEERGLSTAELLGNAALAIVALLAVWALLQTLGTDIVGWIRGQLSSNLEN